MKHEGSLLFVFKPRNYGTLLQTTRYIRIDNLVVVINYVFTFTF